MTKQTKETKPTPPKSDFEKMLESGRIGYSSAGATRKK
jgi:hypothetical protein